MAATTLPFSATIPRHLNPQARGAYLNAVANNGNSELLKDLEEYLNVVIKNDNKLTSQVEEYRNSLLNKYIPGTKQLGHEPKNRRQTQNQESRPDRYNV